MSWAWIELDAVLCIHEEQLLEHGGGNGVRDATLLDSALAMPQQLANYGTPDVFDLAAAYAYGIARNRPFIDGNKRTAWVVARVFMILHGWDRNATDEQCYLWMIQLAAGEIEQDAFEGWLRASAERAEITWSNKYASGGRSSRNYLSIISANSAAERPKLLGTNKCRSRGLKKPKLLESN